MMSDNIIIISNYLTHALLWITKIIAHLERPGGKMVKSPLCLLDKREFRMKIY
jgi:hypothetical protein